jgi:hypothetical protein
VKPFRLNGKTILRFPIKAKIGIILIFALVFTEIAQSQTSKPYYFEIRAASQNSFGPSENQAEIVGGISGENHSFLRQLPSLVFLSEGRCDLPGHLPVL